MQTATPPSRLRSLALLLAAALPGWGQTGTGAVNGTIFDQTRAVIPAATVTLTNIQTNVALKTTSNASGYYLFPAVVPGGYKLRVEVPGMQAFEANATVQVQQRVSIDPVLLPGQTSTTITVAGEAAPLVTAEAPALGHVLERQRIEQLPINGRMIQSLFATVPGMEGERTSGMRRGAHEYVLDGAPLGDRSYLGRLLRPPGLDTIQEFKVETNNSSAKFNRPVSIIMSTRTGTNALHGSLFETHRNNAFGKARARQDLTTAAPKLIRNEFGGSAGGPVLLPKLYNGKNRTFWFFAYEGYRERRSSTSANQVPTAAMRKGDFSELKDSQGRLIKIYDPLTTDSNTWFRQQFAYQGRENVIDPARLNPLAKYLYDLTPLPTHPEVNPLISDNWYGQAPVPFDQSTITARFDHNITDNDRVYARLTFGEWEQWALVQSDHLPAAFPWNWKSSRGPNKSLAISYNRTFSPTLFNELLVSGTKSRWQEATDPDAPVHLADELGLPNPLGSWGRPNLYNTGLSSYFFREMNERDTPFGYVIVDDNATKILGRHEFQFGVHFRYDQLNELGIRQDTAGNHGWNTLATALYDPKTSRTNPQATPQTGHDLANMFLGVMNYSAQKTRGWYQLRGEEYALYLQDNFKATPRLTLNLGLRWEHWPPITDKNNVMTSFDADKRAIVLGADLDTLYHKGATFPSIVNRLESLGAKFISYEQAGLPRSLMNTTWRDFGPRLGFAYKAFGQDRPLVVRGGFRTSFFPISIQVWTWRMYRNAPFAATFTNSMIDAAQSPDGIARYGMRSVPTIFAGVNSKDAISVEDARSITRGSPQVSYFNPNVRQSRIHDWNLTLEREILPHTVARASYVGNAGRNMELYKTYNVPTPDYIWYVTTGEKLPTGEFAPVARRTYDKQVYGDIDEYTDDAYTNYNGVQLELERRYHNGLGFQLFYVMSNTFNLWYGGAGSTNAFRYESYELNQFLPGAVPQNYKERVRFLNYRRDASTPKHRVRWNWVADLPFGSGKLLGRNSTGLLDKIIGGWQIAGMGSVGSNYFALPENIFPTGEPIEIYGTKYPIEDCRSGRCRPGYLWWNGYIPANKINSYDANGKPNGVMGVPETYKPAAQPLIPWLQQPNKNDPMYQFYGTNTVWVTLKDGTAQRTTYNDNLHAWRNQFKPGVWRWGLDASLFKTVAITEQVNVRFNADFFNVLNMPGLPTGIANTGILDAYNSGQSPRELQLTLRLTW